MVTGQEAYKIHSDISGILQHIRKIYHLKKSKNEQLLTIVVVVPVIIVKPEKIIL